MNNEGERFARLSDLFAEIVELPPSEREEAVAERCGDDPALAAELWTLLTADEDSAGYLGAVVSTEVATFGSPDAHGQVLGPWRIIRPLAEGGMGTVYLAERADGSYQAQAAVKLVRGGISSPILDERLRAERQILAGLSHPGIAQLLDGGTTPDGTPYLVLEYVEGEPLTRWCVKHGRPVDDRIRLFLKVCDAVEYAHGQLVAHRDLKPNNILVTADGEPKLLDFGIAKIVDSVDQGSGGATISAHMTPSYASPEQIAGQRAGAAADIYALGVLLYVLLTDRLPLPTHGLTPVALQKVVLFDVPPLPSTVADPERRRRLTGDLDAVASHALRKEPGERYPSVRAMAEDLRHHLAGLPVSVRRDDWAYRAGKLVRRNAGTAAGLLISLLTLVGFSISTMLQARALAAERDRADAERQTAEQVSGFLEELLSEADPNESDGREVTAREVLDRGAARVLSGLSDQPEVQAALATVMGRVYRNLAAYDAAEPLLDSAVAIRFRAGSEPAAQATTLLERGALAYDVGDYERGLELSREALQLFRALPGGVEQETADAVDWVAQNLMALGREEEAEPWVRETVRLNRELHGEVPDPNLATSLINLADLLRSRGDLADAEPLNREGLAMMRALSGGEPSLDVAWALNQLASTLYRGTGGDEAVRLVRESLSIRAEILDGPHVETAASLGNLANILASLERWDEALEARRASLDMLGEVFDTNHPYVAGSLHSLGYTMLQAGRSDEARPILERATILSRDAFGPDHPRTANAETSLGSVMIDEGAWAEAESLLRHAYDVRRSSLPEGHVDIADTAFHLGRALDRMGRTEEAEQLLRKSLDDFDRAFGTRHERTRAVREELADHYERRGLTERAASLRATASG